LHSPAEHSGKTHSSGSGKRQGAKEERKMQGKDGPVHDPGAVIRNILFRKRILQFPVAGGAETEAGSSD